MAEAHESQEEGRAKEVYELLHQFLWHDRWIAALGSQLLVLVIPMVEARCLRATG